MINSHNTAKLNEFLELLPIIIDQVNYSELYGYDLKKLSESSDVTEISIRDCLLTKFLVANKFLLDDAVGQLKNTLAWRKAFNPLSAGFLESHDEKLKQLGVISSVPVPEARQQEEKTETEEEAQDNADSEPGEESKKEPAQESKDDISLASENNEKSNKNLITTWNLYSDFKSTQLAASDLNAFIRWRVGVMERGIALLDFTQDETAYISQLHDYNKVSIIRMDPAIKEATKTSIDLFQSYYPEMLDVQYIVNIPTVMQWVFNIVKHFIAKQTLEKFRVVSNGTDLAKVTGATWVPKQYGGSGESLEAIEVTDIQARNPQLITLYVPEPVAEPDSADAEKNALKAIDQEGEANDIPPETHVPFSEKPIKTEDTPEKASHTLPAIF